MNNWSWNCEAPNRTARLVCRNDNFDRVDYTNVLEINMKKIQGDIQVHCCFSPGDKCDYAEMKNGECVYNNTDDMVCTNGDVRNELLKNETVNFAEELK